MLLHVMSEMVRLGKVIEGSRRARGAKGKVIKEGGKLSGRYSVHAADTSVMEECNEGEALGKPMSPAEAPGMQAGVCDGGCDGAAGAVGGIPDQP